MQPGNPAAQVRRYLILYRNEFRRLNMLTFFLSSALQLSLKTRAMDVVMGVQAMYETILHN